MVPTRSTNALALLAGALLLAGQSSGQLSGAGSALDPGPGISTGQGGSVARNPGQSIGTGSSSVNQAASGVGDPILTGFNGEVFEFAGEVGAVYSLLSQRNHQLSTRLKLATMWDHNGTYMEAFSLRYRDHHVIAELTPDDKLQVLLDGQPLVMREGETSVETLLGLVQGELSLHWELFKPGYGTAVSIATETVELLVWVTPAGTKDEGGKEQPAYLNFDLQLARGPDTGGLEGVIGRTSSAKSAPAHQGAGQLEALQGQEYRMHSFLDTSHPHSLFEGADKAAAQPQLARKLLGRGHTTQVLKAGFHP